MTILRYMDAQHREDRRAASERADRMEALFLARAAPPAAVGFTPNKGFSTIPPFSGEAGQALRPWLHQFQSTARALDIDEASIARELRLKLTGPALQWYDHGFTPEAKPTTADVVAHLAKEFIKSYQGASLFGAYYQYERTAGCSGRDVKRDLNKARQAMRDDGIPVDDISPSEVRYYLYQLALSTAQASQFLATLSSNALASDDYLQSLTPPPEGSRRESLARPQNSEARTACFDLRVALIEAFLDHDHGDQGHGGKARAAATTGTPADTPGPNTPPPTQPLAPANPPGDQDREARVRSLKAEWSKRGRNTERPPQYHGSNDTHLAANSATFAERKAAQACFGCREDQLVPGQRHWECKFHGQDAPEASCRARVRGSQSRRG
jgi:hypothetical protein